VLGLAPTACCGQDTDFVVIILVFVWFCFLEDGESEVGLVYRALWNDDRADLHSAAARAFSYWVSKLDRQTSEPVVVDPFETDSGGATVGACRTTLSEQQSSLSVSMSTLCQADSQLLLVEADPESGDSPKPYRGVLTELVRDLVDDGVSGGGRPRGEVLDISAGAQSLDDDSKIKGLLDQVNDPNRTVALVVVLFDYGDFDLKKAEELERSGVSQTDANLEMLSAANERSRGRAENLAALMAGVAVVKWVPQSQVLAAQREFDPNPAAGDSQQRLDLEDWRLTPGRVRLYPVGIDSEDRSRTYHETIARSHPDLLVDEILSAVEPALMGRRLPAGFLDARRALELSSARNLRAVASDIAEQELQEARENVAELRENLEVHRQLLDDAKRQNDQLTLQLVNYQLQENSPGPDQGRVLPRLNSQPLNISDAISRVRENEMRVEIPDEAIKDIERLDTGIHARGDAREVWRGLLALHWYAKDQERESQYKDFAHWCKRSKHAYSWSPHPKKLAMNESKSVKRDPRLRDARECPISREVDPSGKTFMYPHLKISTQTQNAPRMYFYDDSLGRTRKIHVGFIGPHDWMPNSTT